MVLSRIAVGLENGNTNVGDDSMISECYPAVSRSTAVTHTGHIVLVTFVMDPLLTVPVRPVRASVDCRAPAALHLLARTLKIVIVIVVIV